MLRLISPAEEYRDTYLAALREFQAEGRYADKGLAELARDFPAYVRDLCSRADRAHVAPGRVPETVLWLADDDTYVGRLSIRHELNEYLRLIGGHVGFEIRPSLRRRGYGMQILRLALPHARALGLERVLVTCDASNIASRKIIEANAGVLENAVTESGASEATLRFWITLPA